MTKLPVWQVTNAWRELFARIFENVEYQLNVSPEWLINPATNRKLKLDILYPDIGMAVWFEGLQGKQRKRRLSLEEEIQQQNRGDARQGLCAQNGIYLILVQLWEGKPQSVFKEIDTALSRAGRRVKQNDTLWEQVKTSRATASALSRKIFSEADLKLYADLWNDRQFREVEQTTQTNIEKEILPVASFTEGMEVEHASFGPGVIISISPTNDDTLLTVDFITAGQKTLAASLVAGKLTPRNAE